MSVARLLAVCAVTVCVAGASANVVAQGGAATEVGVDAVRLEPLSQTVPVIGRVVARQSGQVTAQVAGPVEEVMVTVGDRVSRGDVLARIERAWLSATRDDRAAAVEQSEAQVTSAQASAAMSSQELRRLERLRKSAAFNQARFEDARQEYARAQAEILRAQAQLASAEAQLVISATNLERSEVQAPYDGVITRRLTEAGDYVTIGAPVVEMVDDTSIEIEADVPYDRLAGLTPGRTVTVTFSDGVGETVAVRAVIPVENPLTRTQAVRFAPQFGPDRRRTAINQSVTLSVPAGAPRVIPTVHKDGVLRSQRGASVFVVNDGKAVQRPVQLGESVGNRLEVLDGLAAGDLVVVRGNERIRPNEPVRYEGGS